jgi:tetratricopeptide (TPR) repeat protein
MDTEILLADGTFVQLLRSIGEAIWTNKQETRRIKRIHKFDTPESDPHQYEIEGNWMTASHFTRPGEGKKWRRVSETRGNNLLNRRPPQESVYAVELDTDDHLTLRGGLQVATFGNCLIVEPRRQGYTQDFHFNLEQALRSKNLLKTHIIEWYHAGIGHRADGSLILDTDRIKLPQTTASLSSEVPTEPSSRPKLETYRDCGRCRKPEAKLKCACLATHYCDTRCQREDLPDHRRECTHMILKDVHRIQHQLDEHKTNHGQFTIEVARLELVLTETHVKLADILRSSLLGRNQPASEDHYLQALKRISRLVQLAFIQERPLLLHNLKADQVAAHLGLGSLYRDQHSLERALDHLNEAFALTEALVSIEDSPGLQDQLGVILTTQGEILNSLAGHSTGLVYQQGTQIALSKQQRAVQIFRQLEESTIGPLRETVLRRLVDSLISLSDTFEYLDLYDASRAAMQEAQGIGEKARREDSNSPLHQHHTYLSCTKFTMNARKDLDDHTPTLHVGSKVRLYGLLNQTLNGKKGSVTGPARNNRIGIQLQEEQRRVSVRISNIRYCDDPELSCQVLYERLVTKAHIEIATLRTEVKTQEDKSGKKSIHTARARYNLGSALWLSFKPHETALAIQEFTLIIEFMTQREPTHPLLTATLKIRDIALKYIQNFETGSTFAAWPYWKAPSTRSEDTQELGKLFYELIGMTDRGKERTITASTMEDGLHRYGLFGFRSPTSQFIDQATFLTMACYELSERKLKLQNPLHTTPPQNTEHQSSPSSEGDDT